MSRKATDWAWSVHVKPATLKLILLSMADRADEFHCCYPSIQRLVKDTSLDKKTVQSGIAKLTTIGLIQDTGDRKGPTKRVRVFRLALSLSDEDLNVPENGNIPKNGYLNVPKNGYLNVPENGIQNQSLESVIEPNSPSDDEQRSNPLEDAFNEFWNMYPKKVSKAQAFKAWKRIKPTQTKKIEILAALQAQIAARANATGFVPAWKHPSTWLNAESWMDELSFDGDGEISSGTDGIYL